ncbi:MAG TPA: ACP S-malonyltransferase [Acidimicrobiales bacterium]|nr:ACP S-malonyltransferase [Acidimicrobiales bacterium]
MLAFTFPGQGSQRPGMGAPWVDHPSFELVEQAGEAIGRDLSELLLEADEETLRRTENAQIATFVLSLVVLDALERLGIEPAALAGHSLGEYSALVASGSLSYEDGVGLVSERGLAMGDAAAQTPGTMMAVLGLDDDSVEAACVRAEGSAWVANYNAPGQVVIAGAPDALERAAEIAKELGAKRVLSFPVGGAFHTPLMAPARDRLRKALAEVSFRETDPLVVANVDARPHADGADWPALLSAQLASPVRWRQSLEALAELGARTFVEVGPGGVLTGLAKRVLTGEGFHAFSVGVPDDLEALVAALMPAPRDTTREHYAMTERLVLSPATGKFQPLERFSAASPSFSGTAAADLGIEVGVGELIGHAGEAEIRSAFAGTLAGIIVLAGERVVAGQPVAWLRTQGQ